MGKSTLAHKLGQRVPCPVISRDEVKEGVIHARREGSPRWGAPVAIETFGLFYRLVEELLRGGCSVVAEAAFIRGISEPEVRALLKLADGRLVHCETDLTTAQKRFADRAREDPLRLASHPDNEIVGAMEAGAFDWHRYDVMDLDIPIMRVNTQHGYLPDLRDVIAFARDANQ